MVPGSSWYNYETMRGQWRRKTGLYNRMLRAVLAAIVLSGAVLSVCLLVSSNSVSAAAKTVPVGHSQEQDEADVLYASLDTRTHLVTVPAVLTMDVVSSGGSGLYSYQWFVQYDGEGESAVSSEEEYSSHKEISVYRTGKLIVRVMVTDRRTGAFTTAVTDTIEVIDRTKWRWDKAQAGVDADLYYALLMTCLRAGEDPLEDETFVKMLQDRYREQNFTDTQITGIINILKHADALYRDLYLLSFYEYTMFGMQETGSGYIDPPNAAFVSAASSAQSFLGTYFHEAGHGLHMSQWDLTGHPIREIMQSEGWEEAAKGAGNAELEASVMEAIRQDVRNLILTRLEELAEDEGDTLTEAQKGKIADALISADEEVTETVWWWTQQVHPLVKDDPLLSRYYVAVRDSLSSELSQIPYSNANMVGDLYGGMTDHKLKLPYGHAGNYWYTEDGRANGMQLCEGWAEFFSSMVRKDSYYKKINAKYLPGTAAAMERLAEGLRDRYMKYYGELYPGESEDGGSASGMLEEGEPEVFSAEIG